MVHTIELEAASTWNSLSLVGFRETASAALVEVRLAHPAPAPRPRPKPVRAVLTSNPAMARRLAEHAFKPWWMR